MKRNVLSLVMLGCFAVVCLMSCAYFQKRSPDIYKSDTMVDIGTHKLRVVLSDIPSDYTIILEAGGGMHSDAYKGIQDTLAHLTGMRVMSYDRSGFGQSELGPDDFNAIDEVDALKKCLETLGFKSNYILVGHSYGGFLVQLFAARYPDLVSGLILIDPMNVKFVDRFGLDNLNAITPYFENPATDYEKACNRIVDFFPDALDTMRSKELPEQTLVSLITAGNFPFASALWRACHEEMVMNSEKHKLIIADGNGHDIISENPKLVIITILELVTRFRSR